MTGVQTCALPISSADAARLEAGFFATAAAQPDRTALIGPEGELCYGDLAARARHVARRLLARGDRKSVV